MGNMKHNLPGNKDQNTQLCLQESYPSQCYDEIWMDTQVFTMELSSVLPIKASLYIHGFYTNNQLTFLSGQENKDHTVNGTGLDTSTKSNHCPNNITVDPPIFQIQSQFLTFLALHAQLLVAP